MASDMKSAMFLVDNGLFIPSTAPASMLCTPHDGQSFEGEALELTFASDVVLTVDHEAKRNKETWKLVADRLPSSTPVMVKLHIARDCEVHGSYEEDFEPVDLQLGSYRYMNPKKPHPDDLETYFSLQDCIEPSRYPSWVPREETLEEEYDEVQNYSFSITILMHASAFNDFLSYEPKTLESARYGVNLPPFCSTGFSPLIRINTNPKPLGLTYETYQYSSSHHSLESPHKNHNKRHPSPPNKVSSNKRAKLSESSSPAESLTISIPKSVVDFLGIATILHELNGQNLPIAIIFGYIITLTGGILFISYPPTLEELVLYAEVRRLHEQFKTPCGELDNTLIHIFRSLYELPEFGALDTDIIMKLLRALSADELHLWTLRLVAPLINSPELLHSAFDALLPLASTKFLVYLSYASISPRAQYYTLIDPHRPTFEDCTELLCEGENGLELLDLSEDALDLLDQNFVNNLCAQ